MSWLREPSVQPSPARRARARTLRRQATEPEKRLWRHLRDRLPLEDTHFRRQVPIGSYVADFCCLGHRLVIEVDGEQHAFEPNKARDDERTAFLATQGYRVLRFSNSEVMTAIDMVIDTVFAALGTTTPTPDPSPQGGGECTSAGSDPGKGVRSPLPASGERWVPASAHRRVP